MSTTATTGRPQGRATGRPKVVVLGAGFAGLSAVRELDGVDADVLLVDKNAYNTFQPLLFQVSTGGLNPGDVTYSLRTFTGGRRRVGFRQGTATGVDAESKVLRMEGGDDVAYDYLIVSSGIAANYFGIPGAEEHTLTMYTRNGAVEVRDRLMTAFETAAKHTGGEPPCIVVVGGGATGTEMAGAIAELRNTYVAENYPELDPSRVRVVCIEMLDFVLAPFDDSLRQYARRSLEQRGVELRLGSAVAEVREDVVLLKGGEEIPSALTIWTSGVSAPKSLSEWGFPQGRGGRLQTDPDLRIQGSDAVFAVGDVGAVDGAPLPQLAQPAIQTGKHAAANVKKLLAGQPTEAFSYSDKGTMAIVGRYSAVADIKWPFKGKFTGPIGWLMWMGLHITLLHSFRNRLAALTNIASHYVSRSGMQNVIVGEPRRVPQAGRHESDEPKAERDPQLEKQGGRAA
ncbi:NAD(P)/FAD-dependent oxidoreductase [uncultured Pseudokineococcus sp.]|uniref:NAD(P)/FAD-dependent oxidoreductase n=1 Tax=uncultured Pseudokineococcus sp. TaxID=1642928 RepID=UPI00261A08EC|nr:NAD(P)/FAD-dependent oxidoreductase [uncultured Pseudokineococcus sp.]